jgi:hypothetical protein
MSGGVGSSRRLRRLSMSVVGLSRGRSDIEPKIIDAPRQYYVFGMCGVTKEI